ncbi:MAG: YlxM family DNA-binding protein [Syntrophomonadaceae bacterium]|nr:YlxM family DNA-binding protein [Syntrophomonadaceae bacterium]
MTIKIEHISLLKDFYGALLTPKQAETLSLYYEDDWSLAEIAENTGRSRQAVFDILKRAEETLENYEQQLGFMDKYANNRQLLENIESLLNQNDFDKTALAAARKLVRELKTSI